MVEESVKKEWFNLAKLDLVASEVLCNAKLYPQATFFFQQSVEKLNKYIALEYNQFDIKKLTYEIGHKTPIIYKELITQEKKKYEDFLKLSKQFKSLKLVFEKNGPFNAKANIGDANDAISWLKHVIKNPEEVIFIREEDIRELLKQLTKNFDELEKTETNIDENKIDTKKMREELLAPFESFKAYPAVYESIEKQFSSLDDEVISLLIKDGIPAFIKGIQLVYPAYMIEMGLAILTGAHATPCRYPDKIPNFLPSRDYNEDLPFIKLLPELFELHKKAIKSLEECEKWKKGLEEVAKNSKPEKMVKKIEDKSEKCIVWELENFKEQLKPQDWKREWKDEEFLSTIGLTPPKQFRSVAGSGLSVWSSEKTGMQEIYGVDVLRDGIDPKTNQPTVKTYHYSFYKDNDKVYMPLKPKKIYEEHYVSNEKDFEDKHSEENNYKYSEKSD